LQEEFFALADFVTTQLHADEVFTCWFSGEQSDFVRFNHGRVRQAGSVQQRHLNLRLIRNGRHASRSLTLTGSADDLGHAISAISELRDLLAHVAPDPYLLFATDVRSSEKKRPGSMQPTDQIVDEIVSQAQRRDLVGILASGPMFRGFANSLGQRNWHEVENFNLDWSLYHQADKAVKSSYAGFDWHTDQFRAKMESAIEQLALLQRPPVTIEPNEYRVFLAPRALDEIIGMLAWGGLSAKARRTKQSPLIRMEQGSRFHEKISLRENTLDGTAPAFQSDGFIKPESVKLIDGGELRDPLVAARTAKEYGLVCNGANGSESPESIDLAGGALAMSDVLATLDRGLLINNLWYLNFSDRPACRLTGMTRFATFWVEHGKIIAPVNVMRFDDTLYRTLGENLLDLTQEQELMLDASTYGSRSTQSSRLPGALVSAMKFTL
jgi:predicted Zn-dependent protease